MSRVFKRSLSLSIYVTGVLEEDFVTEYLCYRYFRGEFLNEKCVEMSSSSFVSFLLPASLLSPTGVRQAIRCLHHLIIFCALISLYVIISINNIFIYCFIVCVFIIIVLTVDVIVIIISNIISIITTTTNKIIGNVDVIIIKVFSSS